MTPRRDAGFTIVESMLALGLVFSVLVGLLAALDAGVRGVVTGRQRTVALSIANEVMETARGRSYVSVGHDLDSDPTLADDPSLGGVTPNRVYTDLDPGPDEPLAASDVDAGAAAGSPSNPLFPFAPHRWQRVSEATTYTAHVYVTKVSPASGNGYKRLTVAVTWDRRQAAGQALPAVVRLSSYLFDAAQPPDPLLEGLAEADAGSLTVTGTIRGADLADARLFLPSAHGEIKSLVVRRAKGFVTTAGSRTNVRSGSAFGCNLSNGALTAECLGAKLETGSDNDSATAPPDHNAAGPLSGQGGSTAAGTALTSTVGGGTARSLSTARSCWSCYGAAVDDDDRLPYQWTEATGPASVSAPFSAGPVTGSLLTSTTGCATACSTVTVDVDKMGSSTVVRTSAAVSHPAFDLITLPGALLPGYAGMVRLGATNVAATATAGPGALPASASGGPITVQLYDTTALPGYRTVSITPGVPSDHTSRATALIGGALVVLDATVHSGPAAKTSTSGIGALTEAQASLSNWLWVETHLVATDATGMLADLVVHFDYGRVSTRAVYQPG